MRAVSVDASTGTATLTTNAPAATGWNGNAVAAGHETSSNLTWILTDSSPCELHAQDSSGAWQSTLTLPISGCLAMLVNNDATTGSGTAYVSTYAPPHNLLKKINLSNGQVLSTVDIGTSDIRGLAKSPTTSKVWALIVGPGASNGLFEFNPATGAFSNRIDLSTVSFQYWGLAFDSSGRAWFNTFVTVGSIDETHLSSVLPEASSPITTFEQGPRVRLDTDSSDFASDALWIVLAASTDSNPVLASTGFAWIPAGLIAFSLVMLGTIVVVLRRRA
jgi:hypothetical protein